MAARGALAAVAFLGCANHYLRDSFGALQIQLENDFGSGGLSQQMYSVLTAVYFLPNLLTPLAAGAAVHQYGSRFCIIVFGGIGGLGSLITLMGVSGGLGLLLSGRFLSGMMYEPLDAMWVTLLAPIFSTDDFILVSSLANAGQRAGSLMAFLLSPLLYARGGLHLALLLPCVLAAASLPLLATGASTAANRAAFLQPTHTLETELTSLPENPIGSHKISLRAPCSALRLFPYRFWLFCFCAVSLYAAVVPFWFVGSKLLQDKRGLSLSNADALILLPEAAILFLSPPVGLVFSRLRLEMRSKASILAIAQLLTSSCYLLLAADSIPAVIPLLLLGITWAISHTLMWGSMTAIVPAPLLAIGTGLLGAAVNVGPAFMPLLCGQLNSAGTDAAAVHASIYRTVVPLAAAGIAAALGFSLLASATKRPRRTHQLMQLVAADKIDMAKAVQCQGSLSRDQLTELRNL